MYVKVTPKFNPNWDFWFVYIPSGNPDWATLWAIFSQTYLVALPWNQKRFTLKSLKSKRKKISHCEAVKTGILQTDALEYFSAKWNSIVRFAFEPGLPDFSWKKLPRRVKIYQIATKLPNWHKNSNGHDKY
jgi:hypothetical protein